MEGNDTVPKRVKHELSLFAAKRSINKYAIKIRTVTSSIDATPNDSVVRYPDIQQRPEGNANDLGVLQHLLSVDLNVLVDYDDLCALTANLIFDPTILYHMLVRLTDSEMRAANETSQQKLESRDFENVYAHLGNCARDCL